MEHQRRLFLQGAGRLAGLAAAFTLPVPALAQVRGTAYPFSLGVASGSPLPDSVILWTRILSDPLNAASTPPVALAVQWEVAHDQAFTRVVARGTATALPALAHSVHVDVKGLAPDCWYFYRFMHAGAVSPVGRTRTAPAADSMPGMLKLAVASCQHWEFGSYAAHRHIAAASPDLVAFLGDYIYEWGPYSLRHPARAQRVDESFSLAEYRKRYAQYKSDPDLQASHVAAPWIVTWDDHEVANDYARDSDERRDPAFAARRAAAYQAFYEHMPLRVVRPNGNGFGDLRIYHRLDWGRLARFHVLDDRQYRATHACPPAHRGGSSSIKRSCRVLGQPGRSMLGMEQEKWLADGFNSSQARWNIVAQQTPMGQSSQLPVRKPSDGRFWNDGWDGYPAARTRFMEALRDGKVANPVVLSGDVHTFYATDLQMDFNRRSSAGNPVIATEFCGTSVTSGSRPQQRTQQYVDMNPHTKYGRSDKRGYMLMEITPSKTTNYFMALADVKDPKTSVGKLAAFVVEDGVAGAKRVA